MAQTVSSPLMEQKMQFGDEHMVPLELKGLMPDNVLQDIFHEDEFEHEDDDQHNLGSNCVPFA